MNRNRTRGFTYIELMTVSALITILAAILFPVFSRAQHNARRLACANNLQQLYIALQVYARDFNGRFPPQEDDLTPLDSYIRDRTIFRCPGQRPLKTVGLERGRLTNVSYSYFGGLGLDATAGSRVAILSDRSFGFHLERSTYLFVDGHVKWFNKPDPAFLPVVPRLGLPFERPE